MRTVRLREEDVPALGYTLSSRLELGNLGCGLCSDMCPGTNVYLLGGGENETKRRTNTVSDTQ